MSKMLVVAVVAVLAVCPCDASASDPAWLDDVKLDGPDIQTAVLDAHQLGTAPLETRQASPGGTITPLKIEAYDRSTTPKAVIPVARDASQGVLMPSVVLPAALVLFGVVAALVLALVRRSG